MQKFAIPALMFVTLFWSGCDRSVRNQQAAATEANRQWEETTRKFAEKYNAETDWEARLPERAVGTGPFSIDLTRNLVTTNGRPVLLVMDLNDLVENREGLHARFSRVFFNKNVFQLQVDLGCSPELSKKLEMMKGGIFQDHAVIARISVVSRAKLELAGKSEGEDAEIEANYSPTVFFAKGECIDVMERESVSTTPKRK